MYNAAVEQKKTVTLEEFKSFRAEDVLKWFCLVNNLGRTGTNLFFEAYKLGLSPNSHSQLNHVERKWVSSSAARFYACVMSELFPVSSVTVQVIDLLVLQYDLGDFSIRTVNDFYNAYRAILNIDADDIGSHMHIYWRKKLL